jgi:hypothetical protein
MISYWIPTIYNVASQMYFDFKPLMARRQTGMEGVDASTRSNIISYTAFLTCRTVPQRNIYLKLCPGQVICFVGFEVDQTSATPVKHSVFRGSALGG